MQNYNIDQLEDGFERLNRRLTRIANLPDYAEDLMLSWWRIMEADNREGVLAGTNKDGNPAPNEVPAGRHAPEINCRSKARPVSPALASQVRGDG